MNVIAKNFLITGSSGFIGSNLIRQISQAGHMSSGVDIASKIKEEALDITSVDWEEFDLSRFDCVVHLAAKVSVKESFEIPERYYDVNVISTRRLFESCVRQGVPKVVFASSAAVYGDSEDKEKIVGFEGSLSSPYAENKLEGERIAKEQSCPSTRFICLRFFNVYGSGQFADSQYSAVIPLFLRLRSEGRSIEIHGTGSQTRDFIHVNDICRTILSVSTTDAQEFSVLNAGTGKGTTIAQLAEMISKLKIFRSMGDAEVIFSEKRDGDVHHSVADTSGLREVIGELEFIELEDGLSEIACFLEHEIAENGNNRKPSQE